MPMFGEIAGEISLRESDGVQEFHSGEDDCGATRGDADSRHG